MTALFFAFDTAQTCAADLHRSEPPREASPLHLPGWAANELTEVGYPHVSRSYRDPEVERGPRLAAQARKLKQRRSDAHKALRRRWYAENREHARAYAKAWRDANPDKVKANNSKRRREARVAA
jgi:hypothetical protein